MNRVTLPVCLALGLAAILTSCGKDEAAKAKSNPQSSEVEVGVSKIVRKSLARELTVSSELVPFQEIDVYAKESGFVKRLLVDYGDHVRQGQLLAVLEIPELQATIQEDESAIKGLADQIQTAQHQLGRVQAQHRVMHLEYERINGVSQSRPGLVAQQEVDDVQGRDLALEAQIEGAESAVEAARSNWTEAKAKLEHDQALYAYARITAPFPGVVTQRYANLGTLLQAGTNSSTQAMPVVKLSEEDLYRLVIPVPEAYVGSIKAGQGVDVDVSALGRSFKGKVARTSFDVHQDTRTMHTEVDVPNPDGKLLPGMYADVRLTLNQDADALVAPLESVDREGDNASVLVVNSAGKIEQHTVALGIENATDVQILSGLEEGDEVVVSDRSSLMPGQQVRSRLASPAGGAKAKGASPSGPPA